MKKRNSRVVLTQDERELLGLIEKLKLELKLEKQLNGKMGTDKLFNLMNLKDMLLSSLLERKGN